ncbi:MAG: hypothetical protein FJ135_07555 [Deltaproteobacteria bacterium]|nr:hypothetical protein [Deltaproteobacteria bacterium]
MTATELQAGLTRVYTTSWAAFYLYYVAIAICWFGPHLNPEFSQRIFLSPGLGLVLGLLLLAGVIYLKYGQHYEMSAEGVKKVWRYPARQELLRWSEIDRIVVRAGLTQTILRIGNVVIQPHPGQGQEMVWYGLESPKLVKMFLERGLDESTAE